MNDFIAQHLSVIMSILLTLSEVAAAIVQLLYPENKGISGFMAAFIRGLQKLGAQNLSEIKDEDE